MFDLCMYEYFVDYISGAETDQYAPGVADII